jgi:methionyl aminopeptidase
MNDVSAVRAPPAVLPKPNDPCWCGSGTKYKKCHRGADAVEARKRGPAARSRLPAL